MDISGADLGWDDLRLFLAVAETGSLSGAARRLRLGQPTISRRLAALEGQLGYALFRRSVDGAAPTSAAERLLEPARRMAEWASEVERAALAADEAPRGVVRITAPPGVAFDFVAPFAAWLKERLPEVRLELVSTVHYLDLLRREADLALRTRGPDQRDIVGVARVEHENAAFVSRDYKKRLPKRPSFRDVEWIAWAPPLDHLPPNPQLSALIPGFRPAFAADDFNVMLRAAESGLGGIFRARLQHRFSGASPLVPLDLELGPHAKSELHLVCAKSALDIPRVRAVAELLASELARVRRV